MLIQLVHVTVILHRENRMKILLLHMHVTFSCLSSIPERPSICRGFERCPNLSNQPVLISKEELAGPILDVHPLPLSNLGCETGLDGCD